MTHANHEAFARAPLRHQWNAWQRRQHGLVRLAVLAATAAVVLLTLWILGALGLAAGWLGLGWPALESPLGRVA
jgi:hypothetical protein